jgi:glycosyltransferase involved in cell wall biosynthesis
VAELYGSALLERSTRVRGWLAPFAIRRKTFAITDLLERLQPDLVHAMRLPFEGFLAAAAVQNVPLVLSIWGNDFTLFADRDRRLNRLTTSALARADALHCDCKRDLKSAFARGFSQQKPWRVLPGNGGVQTGSYHRLQLDRDLLRQCGIPEGRPLIINPRGFRAYVRNDTFFNAIPLVLKRVPEAFFIATGMMGNPVAERWIRSMGIASSVRLLHTITREQLALMFAACEISLSPSSHDGTPNTLLEAMACGCFPITGSVDSIREWITDGENGLICDECDANSLAQAIIRASQDNALRQTAKQINRELIRTRADYATGMLEAEKLYAEALASKSSFAVHSGARNT